MSNFTHIKQTNTGNFSYFNCGPAVCVAAIKYYANALDKVRQVRKRCRSWTFWTFSDITRTLSDAGIPYTYGYFKWNLLPTDQGMIIVNVDMKQIPRVTPGQGLGRTYAALPLIPFKHYLCVIDYNAGNDTYLVSDPLEDGLVRHHVGDVHAAINAQCATYLVIPSPQVEQQATVLSYDDVDECDTND